MQPDPVNVPDGFAFSQSSLQDFVDCARRFELKYLLRLSWPAIQSEPVQEVEHSIRMGEQFHRLAHQRLLGISSTRLESLVQGSGLENWWMNFNEILENAGEFPVGMVTYPEVVLQATLGEARLVAKYDLILVKPDGNLAIIDWKTSKKAHRRDWLVGRLQTRLYPYLLIRAGASLIRNQALAPSQVEMIYWYVEETDRSIHFRYDDRQYSADEAYLIGLISRIRRMEAGAFPLTTDEKHCRYCVYRSLCERGVQAAKLDEDLSNDPPVDESGDLVLDFEHISEIEF
jgi:CRISPR/Cas system-associated exonuclease Cas4 (RecB family)